HVTDAAARNVDGLVLGERAGRVEALLADEQRAARHDREQDEEGEHQVAGDHQRMARAGRAVSGHGHALGLERGTRAARRNQLFHQFRSRPGHEVRTPGISMPSNAGAWPRALPTLLHPHATTPAPTREAPIMQPYTRVRDPYTSAIWPKPRHAQLAATAAAHRGA